MTGMIDQSIVDATKELLARSRNMFGITITDVSIQVMHSNRRVMGRAIHDRGQYIIELNPDAIVNHKSFIIEEVLPHEMAHLVCFNKPEIGNDHDAGWANACKLLGGSGRMHHDVKLRGRSHTSVKCVYQTKLGEMHVPASLHRKIQREGILGIRWQQQEFNVLASDFLRGDYVQSDGLVTSAVLSTEYATKKDHAAVIVREMHGESPKKVIERLMQAVQLTKPAASTYYYSLKKSV